MTATEPATREPDQTERTEHPHVVKTPGVLGGQPRVDGLRLGVPQLARLYESGVSAADLVRTYAPLTLAELHDALSYAHDHPDEMAEQEARQTLRSVLRRHDLVFVDIGSNLVPRDRLRDSDVPSGATAYTWETLPDKFDRP